MAKNNIEITPAIERAMSKLNLVGAKNGIKAKTSQTNVELVYIVFEKIHKLSPEIFEKITGLKK